MEPDLLGRPRLAAACTLPRAGATRVCSVCKGPVSAGFQACWSCSVVARRLQSCFSPAAPARNSCGSDGGALGAGGECGNSSAGSGAGPPVVPITLFRPGSPIHRALVGYKSGRSASEREALAGDVADLVGSFLTRHGACIARLAGGGWDYLDVVPSTRRYATPHPLARALGSTTILSARDAHLLRRASAPMDHLQPDPAGFVARRTRARVLLLDDVFTTGARAFSAARALQASGAEVVAIVPVGRMVHTDDSRTQRWWEAAYHPRSVAEWVLAPCCVECSRPAA